jgi:hypothetical protein
LVAELKARYMTISRRNMLMSAELLRIMKLLEENNIPALAFKGPALSQMAYGDITLRQYGDLDILIPPENLFKAATLLEENAYTLQGSIHFLHDPLWIKASKDMVLVHQQKNIIIEMHWKLFHSTFAKNTQEIHLWDERDTIYINKKEVHTLNKNLLLSYLCIHGSRHLWERVEWIVDIDRIIRKNDLSWSEILKYANLFHSRTMLLLGLSLSHLLFSTKLPKDILSMLHEKKITHLTQTMIELLNTPLPKNPTFNDIVKRKRIHASMQDGIYNKIIYWKNIFFQKNYTAILEENTPNKHQSLLNITRPYYLIKKFIFTKG